MPERLSGFKKSVLIYTAATILYLSVSAILYPSIWNQALTRDSTDAIILQGETPVYEFAAETVRNNILSLKNPFEATHNVLYPMGWNFAMDDVSPINGVWFLFLRPFFPIHMSFMLIVLASVLASNVSMFALLRKLKVSNTTSFFVGLLFGFTPFVTYRISGHPTYVSLYLISVPVLLYLLLARAATQRARIIYSLLLALSFVMIVLTNLYFAIMFILMFCVYVFFAALIHFNLFKMYLKKTVGYLLFAGATAFIILIPWTIKIWDTIHFAPAAPSPSWIDSITYSSDFLTFFWPAQNVFYAPFLRYINSTFDYKPFFETLIYPGIIVISSIIAYIFLYKKLPVVLRSVYATALMFIIFTFGPYLIFFKQTTQMPLPYILVRITPFFEMARAPGRFIVPAVFLMAIVTAFVIEYLLKKYHRKYRFALVALIAIFFIDHSMTIAPVYRFELPSKIYAYLETKPQSPLLEIPFSIRDGLKNHGYLHAVWSMQPQHRHDHPLFGVYAGRVPDASFAYFQTNPLFGPLGKIITIETAKPQDVLKTMDQKLVSQTLDFYRIEYVMLKHKEAYSATVIELLKQQAFNQTMRDGNYSLWYRKPGKKLASAFEFATPDQSLYLQDGWSTPDSGGRWIVGKSATMFLPTQQKDSTIRFSASTLADNQSLTLYSNRNKIGTVAIEKDKKEYTLPISADHLNDVSMLYFETTQQVIPSQLDTKSKDTRPLAVFMHEIHIE